MLGGGAVRVATTASRVVARSSVHRLSTVGASRLLLPTMTTTAFRPSASTQFQCQQRQSLAQRLVHTSTVVRGGKPPLTKKTLEERIILVLSCYDKIDPTKLTLDSRFVEDLGLDSLDFVEVIMAFEDEFLFEIPDGDADRLKTPRDVFQYICDKEDVYH